MNIYETVQEELAKEASAIQKVAKQLVRTLWKKHLTYYAIVKEKWS